MARGDAPIIKREAPKPPEGVATPDKVLMVHPACGYRWIPKDEQERCEKWGYEFVRRYSPNDKLGATVDLAGLSKEQLLEKSRMLAEMAGDVGDKPAEKTPAEKAYAAKKAQEKAVRDKMEARRGGHKSGAISG